jgi:hypothetical protein
MLYQRRACVGRRCVAANFKEGVSDEESVKDRHDSGFWIFFMEIKDKHNDCSPN